MTVFASSFSWLHLIEKVHNNELFTFLGIHELNYTILHSWGVCIFLIVIALLIRRSLMKAWSRKGLNRYFADDKVSLLNMAEIFVQMLGGVMGGMLEKKDVRKFFPFVGGLFIFIFTCNIIAIIPGFQPPTDNINSNVGMAIIVFLAFIAIGMMRDWKGFLGHLWGPVLFMGPLIFPIEVFGMCMRPVTLTIRLTVNIFGDHTLFGAISDLVGWVVPIPFIGLAIFVSAVQAFVFALLTTVYIGLSVPHADHDEH
jgi:F-type H+-transporting ATPase subunit a